MHEMNQKTLDPYLLRKLEESNGFYASSFSNRYCNWKRVKTIREALSKELKRYPDGSSVLRILDIGCGDGSLMYRLKAVFDKVRQLSFTGIDVSGLDIDFANKRREYFGHKDCDFQVMDANVMGFKEDKFDIIITSEVAEHMSRPGAFVSDLRRILKPGGLLILTTPNGGGGALVKLIHIFNIFTSGILKKARKRTELLLIDEKERELSRLSSSGGSTGAGFDHVSVMPVSKWIRLFKDNGFIVQGLKGTGGLLFGDPFLDNHRILFAFSVILDVIIEKFSFSHFFSETIFFELRKA